MLNKGVVRDTRHIQLLYRLKGATAK